MMKSNNVIFLMGPTASGKTSLALELAQTIACEIISVDSALVYKGMNIGTAKPSAEELALVPHHLIDIRDPSQPYSAADFCADALPLIDDIQQRQKTPVLVGGTMLYFHALLNGLSTMPSANSEVRADIIKRATEIGWPALHQQLAQIDPIIAQRINVNDQQRIQRALEIYALSGEAPSKLQAEQQAKAFSLPVFQFAISPLDRAVLHQRIEQRFDQMLSQGFIDEVSALYQRGDLTADLPAIRAVGYRQAWQYLENTMDYDTMRYKGIVATRQLAKRQLTWLRGWPNLNWLDSNDTNNSQNILKMMKNS